RYSYFKKHVLPIVLKYKIAISEKWRGGGGQHDSYRLNYSVEHILKAKDPSYTGLSELREFWIEISKLD
ncbi:MAG: hypothetical protein CUN55_21130, partial [Phototrophicales bacterium]